jgi:alanyl-tRNA synthetase
LVFNITPFYAEGGGQVGDTGYIESEGKKYAIIDVKKEHNQIIHFTKELPNEPGFAFKAYVNRKNVWQQNVTIRLHTCCIMHYVRYWEPMLSKKARW